MTNKLFIIAVCAAVGSLTGFTVMRAYKRRLCYFVGVCDMIGELKRNVSYKKESASAVLGSFATNSSHLKKNIDEYVAYAAAKDGELEISRGFLSEGDHAKVKELFGALGSSDGDSQLSRLDEFSTVFGGLKEGAAVKADKYGALSVKLGFLLGLGVGVLFL